MERVKKERRKKTLQKKGERRSLFDGLERLEFLGSCVMEARDPEALPLMGLNNIVQDGARGRKMRDNRIGENVLKLAKEGGRNPSFPVGGILH
jgi:hypothetical protein